MRRSGLGWGRRAFAAGLAGLILGLASCARGGPGPATTPSEPTCAASSATLTLTEADSGRSFCLAPGTRIEVYLHGTQTAQWSPIQLAGPALRAAVSGKRALARDVTGGFYDATTDGEAQLSSSRPACPTSTPGTMRCGAEQSFRVDVIVH